MAEQSGEDELVVRPRLTRSARVVVPVSVGLVVIGLVFNGDAIALILLAVLVIVGLWALSVRTKVLFVNASGPGSATSGGSRGAPSGATCGMSLGMPARV